MKLQTNLLEKERDKAKEMVENIIESELGYLFTNDLDYLNYQRNIYANIKKVYEMRQRIDSYFNIIVRNLRDSIAKAIGYF